MSPYSKRNDVHQEAGHSLFLIIVNLSPVKKKESGELLQVINRHEDINNAVPNLNISTTPLYYVSSDSYLLLKIQRLIYQFYQVEAHRRFPLPPSSFLPSLTQYANSGFRIQKSNRGIPQSSSSLALFYYIIHFISLHPCSSTSFKVVF